MLKSKRKWILIGVCAILVLGGVVGYFWRYYQTRQWIASALPSVPELASNQMQYFREADDLARKDVSGRAMGTLAQTYHANGFFGEAARVYDALIQLQPREAKWNYLLADILSGYGQSDEAAALLKRTIELDPNALAAHLRLGEVYQQSNQPDEARKQFLKALEIDRDNLHARLGIARLEMDAENWSAAITLLKELTRLRPDFGAAWALLETAYTAIGAEEEAEQARFQNTQSVSFYDIVDPWKHGLLDYCYDPYRLRIAASTPRLDASVEESVALLLKAISLNPDDADIRRQLGNLLMHTQRFEAAEQHMKNAIIRDPENPDGWAFLVNLYNEWGKPELAEKTTIDGLLKCPTSPALNLEWGRQLSKKGQYREALQAFRTMNRLRPEESSGYIEIALIHFRLNQVEAGLEQLEKALQVEPGNAVAITSLAVHAIQSGDENKASEWIAKAKAQPKVPRSDISKLETLFENTFSHSVP